MNRAGERRRAALERNVAQGAATTSFVVASRVSASKKRAITLGSNTNGRQATKSVELKDTKPPAKKQRRRGEADAPEDDEGGEKPSCTEPMMHQHHSSTTTSLVQKLKYLSPCYDEDPQLFIKEEGLDVIHAVESITPDVKVLIFLTMVR